MTSKTESAKRMIGVSEMIYLMLRNRNVPLLTVVITHSVDSMEHRSLAENRSCPINKGVFFFENHILVVSTWIICPSSILLTKGGGGFLLPHSLMCLYTPQLFPTVSPVFSKLALQQRFGKESQQSLAGCCVGWKVQFPPQSHAAAIFRIPVPTAAVSSQIGLSWACWPCHALLLTGMVLPYHC